MDLDGEESNGVLLAARHFATYCHYSITFRIEDTYVSFVNTHYKYNIFGICNVRLIRSEQVNFTLQEVSFIFNFLSHNEDPDLNEQLCLEYLQCFRTAYLKDAVLQNTKVTKNSVFALNAPYFALDNIEVLPETIGYRFHNFDLYNPTVKLRYELEWVQRKIGIDWSNLLIEAVNQLLLNEQPKVEKNRFGLTYTNQKEDVEDGFIWSHKRAITNKEPASMMEEWFTLQKIDYISRFLKSQEFEKIIVENRFRCNVSLPQLRHARLKIKEYLANKTEEGFFGDNPSLYDEIPEQYSFTDFNPKVKLPKIINSQIIPWLELMSYTMEYLYKIEEKFYLLPPT